MYPKNVRSVSRFDHRKSYPSRMACSSLGDAFPTAKSTPYSLQSHVPLKSVDVEWILWGMRIWQVLEIEIGICRFWIAILPILRISRSRLSFARDDLQHWHMKTSQQTTKKAENLKALKKKENRGLTKRLWYDRQLCNSLQCNWYCCALLVEMICMICMMCMIYSQLM